jgi:hypothetical protein
VTLPNGREEASMRCFSISEIFGDVIRIRLELANALPSTKVSRERRGRGRGRGRLLASRNRFRERRHTLADSEF